MAQEIYKNDLIFKGTITATGSSVIIPKYDNVLTTVNTSSANWESAYLNQGNYLPLAGGTLTGDTKFNQNVTIFGDLSCTGTQTFKNTIFTTTSALSVVHVGSGPAMWVGNNGTGDIASFYDIDQNIEVLHVGGTNSANPNVGVKTSTPNKDFTVNGEVSASGNIWTSGDIMSGGQELLSGVLGSVLLRTDDTTSTVNANSANWNAAYNSLSNSNAKWDSVYSNVNTNSAAWYNTFSTVLANSAQWSVDNSSDLGVRALTGTWQDTYSTVQVNSAFWSSPKSEVSGLSANWQDTYTSVYNNSGRWESVFTYTQAASSEFATRGYTYNTFLPLTGGTITGDITASNIQATTVRLSNAVFTGNSTVANSITADNTFIQITLNGVNKYIRLYDVE